MNISISAPRIPRGVDNIKVRRNVVVTIAGTGWGVAFDGDFRVATVAIVDVDAAKFTFCAAVVLVCACLVACFVICIKAFQFPIKFERAKRI